MADPAHEGDLPHPSTGVRYPSPVPPGTGWPGDPASEATPVATSPARVRTLSRDRGLSELDAAISVCRACPRLVAWREDVARTKRASFSDQPYWGRPVPGWGSEEPGVLVVGLAPAANGANRTGRVFTGDSSGDWLFAALHRVGLATRPTSTHADDGQELVGTRMVATVRCAPPQNRPTTTERDTCAPWIDAEVRQLAPYVRVVVALGSYGWDGAIRSLRAAGYDVPRPKPRFGHAVEVEVSGPHRPVTLLGCYHPSQHNTFTGRLTPQMLDTVLGRARDLAGIQRS